MNVNPYLLFNGNCEEAFKFYAKCLGGKIEAMLPHEGTPDAANVPPGWAKKILHARLNVDGQLLMGSDCPPEYFRKPGGFAVSILTKDPVEAERIFNALAENGQVHMPFQETFWALRFGMCVDQFGTPWMVNCEKAG